MPKLVIERAHYSIPYGQLVYRDEAEEYMARQWGWIVVQANMNLKCKVCDEAIRGWDVGKHLQMKDHIAAKNKLAEMIVEGNGPDDDDYCEGCCALIREDNPFEDTSENTCQLGYCYKETDIDGQTKITYNLGQDLFRPDDCRFGRQ